MVVEALSGASTEDGASHGIAGESTGTEQMLVLSWFHPSQMLHGAGIFTYKTGS